MISNFVREQKGRFAYLEAHEGEAHIETQQTKVMNTWSQKARSPQMLEETKGKKRWMTV